MWVILAPVISKPKTKSGNMLPSIDILKWKFILRRKNQKWASTRQFRIWQLLWTFEVFGNFLVTFCIILLNFAPKKVCYIQNQISRHTYEVQFLIQSNQKIIISKMPKKCDNSVKISIFCASPFLNFSSCIIKLVSL